MAAAATVGVGVGVGAGAGAAASAAAIPTSVLVPSDILDTYNQSWKVSDLASYYKKPTEEHPEGEGRIRLPIHQREWAWTAKRGLKKMRDLVKSILHGFPIPSIILNEVDVGQFQVYDGRHRIETLVRFMKDEFAYETPDKRLFKFSQLCELDRYRFQMRELPVIITRNATPNQLAEVFIRLNSGKPLTQADYCWACRHRPLIKGTLVLLAEYRDRFRELLGGVNLLDRKNLPDWAGIFAGIMRNDADAMTTSFERLQEHLDLPLDMTRGHEVMEALLTLYTRANERITVDARRMKEYVRLGFINAFFLAAWMKQTDETVEACVEQWVTVIDHIRRTGKKKLVKVEGAQNLNQKKIEVIHTRVAMWLARGEGSVGSEDEEESDVSDD